MGVDDVFDIGPPPYYVRAMKATTENHTRPLHVSFEDAYREAKKMYNHNKYLNSLNIINGKVQIQILDRNDEIVYRLGSI